MVFGESSRTGLPGAVRGLLEGGAVFLVVALVRLAGGKQLISSWFEVASIGGLAAVCFAVGRAVTGQLSGAILGAIPGVMVAGFFAGPYLQEMNTEDPDKFEPGEVFELKGPGLEGKSVDAADHLGKIVLVDFWATWCPPCRQEMPGLKRTYEKYRDDGFEIIGVSLDQDVVQLQNYLKEHEITWPQIFLDDKDKPDGFHPLARRYNVQTIPSTFLLDREGRLLARNVRGPAVEKAVARLVGKGDGAGSASRTYEQSAALAGAVLGLGTLAGSLAGALVQRSMRTPESPPGQAGERGARPS